jgi:hypothetical protein
VFLIARSKTNISALSFKRYFGVSYPTPWLVKHKLMQTMAEREDQRQLKDRVTTDDAYLDSVASVGKRGRGAKKAGLCMAAVEADVDSFVRYVHFDLLSDLSADSIICWAGKALQSTTCLVTDSCSRLSVAGENITSHESVVVSPRMQSDLVCFR